MRALMIAAMAATPALATPARAAEPLAMVCAEPQVLLLVAERLDRAGDHPVIDRASVGQTPGARPDTMECAVRVTRRVVDTPRYGLVPVDVVSTYSYSLRLRRNGIFLLPDRAPG